MTDNKSEDIVSTIITSMDATHASNSKENVVAPITQKTKVSSGGRMPPVIDWTTSSAGSSETKVSGSTKNNVPVGHTLQKTSAGGSPLENQNTFPGMQFFPPSQHSLQFMQSPNPVFGGYQGFYGSPPPYAGFPLPYHPSFPPAHQQMGFVQPSFEDEEEDEEGVTVEQPITQPEAPVAPEGEEDSTEPMPASLLAAKVVKKSVQTALVEWMSDALYQTDTGALKTLRELAVEKAWLPSNMANPVPKLEGKLLTYISSDCAKEDASLVKAQENIWMLMQPIITISGALRRLEGLHPLRRTLSCICFK